jgi:single-stranded DNA-binding protein
MSEFIKPEATITLVGKVFQPGIKQIGSTKLFSFSIPNETRRKDKSTGEWTTQATTWFTIEMWGDKAEEAEALDIFKGDTVKVTGRLEQNTYKSKDGTEKQSFKVAWPEIEVLQKGKSRDEDEI